MKRIILLLLALFATSCVRHSFHSDLVDGHMPKSAAYHLIQRKLAEAVVEMEREYDRLLANPSETVDARTILVSSAIGEFPAEHAIMLHSLISKALHDPSDKVKEEAIVGVDKFFD